MTIQELKDYGFTQIETTSDYPHFIPPLHWLTKTEYGYCQTLKPIYLIDGVLMVNSGVNTRYRNRMEDRISSKISKWIEIRKQTISNLNRLKIEEK